MRELLGLLSRYGFTDQKFFSVRSLGKGGGFGISVIEAMLGGVPAMVSEWTGAKEVVSGLGSDFISELNPESAAKKILKYFDLSLEKKMQLSKKAKNLAREFRRDKTCC